MSVAICGVRRTLGNPKCRFAYPGTLSDLGWWRSKFSQGAGRMVGNDAVYAERAHNGQDDSVRALLRSWPASLY
jgi:hypothetical protein